MIARTPNFRPEPPDNRPGPNEDSDAFALRLVNEANESVRTVKKPPLLTAEVKLCLQTITVCICSQLRAAGISLDPLDAANFACAVIEDLRDTSGEFSHRTISEINTVIKRNISALVPA